MTQSGPGGLSTSLNSSSSGGNFSEGVGPYLTKKKDLLIETLWEIILLDGKVHEFESNLIRRLAGLLYISDVSCGNAKKRAQINLKNHKD